jgi:hypothetical protein
LRLALSVSASLVSVVSASLLRFVEKEAEAKRLDSMWAEGTDVIGDFGLMSLYPIPRSILGPGQAKCHCCHLTSVLLY